MMNEFGLDWIHQELKNDALKLKEMRIIAMNMFNMNNPMLLSQKAKCQNLNNRLNKFKTNVEACLDQFIPDEHKIAAIKCHYKLYQKASEEIKPMPSILAKTTNPLNPSSTIGGK